MVKITDVVGLQFQVRLYARPFRDRTRTGAVAVPIHVAAIVIGRVACAADTLEVSAAPAARLDKVPVKVPIHGFVSTISSEAPGLNAVLRTP